MGIQACETPRVEPALQERADTVRRGRGTFMAALREGALLFSLEEELSRARR